MNATSPSKPGSGIGTVLRELRTALGEIVLGGELDANHSVFIQTLFGLLGYLARADSLVGIEEAEFTNRLMDDLQLPTKGRKLAQQAFTQGCQRQIDIDAELKRVLSSFPKGSKEIDRLYNSLIRLAAIDGKVRAPERMFLDKVTIGLGYNETKLNQRLHALIKN